MKKALVAIALISAALSAHANRDAETLYNQSCIACHSSGAAGAPKTGDAAAWAPRLEKGMEQLLANTKSGINAMPPKGMCMDCNDDEYKALIEFMSSTK
ncbi:MAG TPA: c-type cytochrome [Pseudomonadales bacterium]